VNGNKIKTAQKTKISVKECLRKVGRQSKSGNWLHSQSIDTQLVEEEKAAADTNLAILSKFFRLNLR
jgi:hypothetical protein